MISVETTNKSEKYNIYIEETFSNLGERLSPFSGSKFLVVSDSIVGPLYFEAVKAEILKVTNDENMITYFEFQEGERSKTLETVQKCYEKCAEGGLERKSAIVSLGGGVVGDLAGFVAATYLRGVNFVQIPTTLLAQVDSSVGGKVAVDFLGNKNQIGAFYQPKLVYINTTTLKTLPKEHLSSGMAEAIKHGIIGDPAYFDFILNRCETIKSLNKNDITALVSGSCVFKAKIVSEDEKEAGLREILNFGHTFGHAIETLSNFTFSHGQCVALGMICALNLSVELGFIKSDKLDSVIELLQFFGLETTLSDFSDEEIIAQMMHDKKNKDGRINVVLVEAFGQAKTFQTITNEQLKLGISKIRSES